MSNKRVKVIFDTNIWISFLIGKSLNSIKEYLSNGSIIIVVSEQLFTEINEVTKREKIKKYFPRNSVLELINLLQTIAINVEIESTHNICRDPKDNFLFDLISASEADFLITGDKDVLEHHPFGKTQILTPKDFEERLKVLSC